MSACAARLSGPHSFRTRLAGLLSLPRAAPAAFAASYAAFMRAMFSLEAVAWSTMGLFQKGGYGRWGRQEDGPGWPCRWSVVSAGL